MSKCVTLHGGREKAKDGRTDLELLDLERAAGHTRHPDSEPVQKHNL